VPGKHRKPKEPFKLAPAVAVVALSAAAAGVPTAPPAAADTTIVPVPQSVPEEASSPAAAVPAITTYEVQPGDCVSVIAERVGASTEALYAANRDTIGDDIDLIFPGQVLTIGGADHVDARADHRCARRRVPGTAVEMSVSQAFKGNDHRGIDLRATIGTPGYAVADGTVLLLARRPASGSGPCSARRSTARPSTSSTATWITCWSSAGERVDVGDHIIDTGTNGIVTGPHLHFEVWIGGRLAGYPVDPVTWLAEHGAL
jgi:LysM repeat protein